jgi:hypothetical protein
MRGEKANSYLQRMKLLKHWPPNPMLARLQWPTPTLVSPRK